MLARLREAEPAATAIFFSLEPWLASDRTALLLWEAFVTGKAKGKDHIEDAMRACQAFHSLLELRAWDEARTGTVAMDAQPLNLAALAAGWAGWRVKRSESKRPVIVVRPDDLPW